MLILEIAAGVMLGIVLSTGLMVLLTRSARKKEHEKQIAIEWAARVKFEYHKFWTDELNKASDPDQVLKVAAGEAPVPDYGNAMLEWHGCLTMEDKAFWNYLNQKLSDPIMGAYYKHPTVRTANEQARVAAHPNPLLDADALAARFAIEARAVANRAAIVGA